MVWWLVIVRLLRRYLQFGLVEVGERVKPKVRSRLKTSCKSIGLQNWSSACNGLVTFHYFDISSLHDIVYYHFNNQSTGTSCIFDGQHVSLLIVFWTSQLKRVLPHNNCITVSNHIYIHNLIQIPWAPGQSSPMMRYKSSRIPDSSAWAQVAGNGLGDQVGDINLRWPMGRSWGHCGIQNQQDDWLENRQMGLTIYGQNMGNMRF